MRPAFLLILFTLVTLLMIQPDAASHGQTSASDEQMLNPLIEQRADPWIYRHTDGYYYFTGSVPEYDRIEVRRATTIEGLTEAEPVVVWTKHDTGIMSEHIWAPEIHFIDGKWYIYFAAARVDARFDHRIYVLENESENPLEGTWTEKGQLRTNWESFSLDATTFEHHGVRYLVWAQKDPNIPGNSNLYIAAMTDPWTITGDQVMLSAPSYAWERIGFFVNEGAAVLIRNGRVFITYSASATDANYAMGLLTASADSDLLDRASWTKSAEPVFQTNEATGQYGPGHNSFTVSPEGDDLMVYHARNYREIVGDPLYDPNRHTRVQYLHWNADGTPNFGIPVPDGALPVRFRADDAYLHHQDTEIILTAELSQIESSQFRVVPGLADPLAVSLQAIDVADSYIYHADGTIRLGVNDGSEGFAASATWQIRPGLADETGISFESLSIPGEYIARRADQLTLSAAPDDAITFFIEY